MWRRFDVVFLAPTLLAVLDLPLVTAIAIFQCHSTFATTVRLLLSPLLVSNGSRCPSRLPASGVDPNPAWEVIHIPHVRNVYVFPLKQKSALPGWARREKPNRLSNKAKCRFISYRAGIESRTWRKSPNLGRPTLIPDSAPVLHQRLPSSLLVKGDHESKNVPGYHHWYRTTFASCLLADNFVEIWFDINRHKSSHAPQEPQGRTLQERGENGMTQTVSRLRVQKDGEVHHWLLNEWPQPSRSRSMGAVSLRLGTSPTRGAAKQPCRGESGEHK